MTPTPGRPPLVPADFPRIGARPPLGRYLHEAWQRRAFMYELARVRVASQNSQHRLGIWWVVLQPILLAIIFGTIFGVILPRSTRPDNFVVFLVVGIFAFQYYSKSITATSRAVVGNKNLVQSLAFPRILLPLAAAVEQFLLFLPALGVLLAIVVAFGEPVSWRWLLMIPVTALMFVFNVGVGLIAARLTVHASDVTQVLPLLNRVIFYSSGIFYSLDIVLADKPTLLAASRFNPVADFIHIMREQLVAGTAQVPLTWVVCGALTIIALVTGVVFFWRAEERYGRD